MLSAIQTAKVLMATIWCIDCKSCAIISGVRFRLVNIYSSSTGLGIASILVRLDFVGMTDMLYANRTGLYVIWRQTQAWVHVSRFWVCTPALRYPCAFLKIRLTRFFYALREVARAWPTKPQCSFAHSRGLLAKLTPETDAFGVITDEKSASFR